MGREMFSKLMSVTQRRYPIRHFLSCHCLSITLIHLSHLGNLLAHELLYWYKVVSPKSWREKRLRELIDTKCLQLCPTCRNNFISAQPQGSPLWMWVDRPSANGDVGTVCLLGFQLAAFICTYSLSLPTLARFHICSQLPSDKILLPGTLWWIYSQWAVNEQYCSVWFLGGGGVGVRGFPL